MSNGVATTVPVDESALAGFAGNPGMPGLGDAAPIGAAAEAAARLTVKLAPVCVVARVAERGVTLLSVYASSTVLPRCCSLRLRTRRNTA